ncbi:hypothetical protein KKB44_04860 [Candidatus Micrarchaeota archaeon]|nr:hypothetical protein [Candidatus Micrarchaeota archaeon]
MNFTYKNPNTSRKPEKPPKAFAAAFVTSALLFVPQLASAQDVCSAKTVKGTTSRFAQLTDRSIKINVPTMTAGDHIQISLPSSYSARLLEKTRGLEPSARRQFLQGVLLSNIREGISALGSAKTFDCVSLDPAIPARRTINPDTSRKAKDLPPLPRQIKGGKGTEKRPYVVRLEKGREKGESLGAMPIIFPVKFDIAEGPTVYFKVSLTLSQLKINIRDKTASELKGVMRAATVRYSLEHDTSIGGKVDVNTGQLLRSLAQKVGAQDAEADTYMYQRD